MTLLSSLVPNTLRLAVADTNATPTANIKEVAYTSITAPRTVTLPLAANVLAANTLVIIDESGSVTTTNTITIITQGSDTLNGLTSYVLSAAFGTITLESNGSNEWTSLATPTTATTLGLPISGVLSRGKILALAIRN